MPSITFMVISVSIETIIYFFHATVLVLLFCKRKTSFKSAFYDLMRIILLADLCVFVTLVFEYKISLFFVDFFKSSTILGPIVLNFLGYLSIMQFFGHFMMAFNRFTIFWFPFKHEWIWRGNWYIYAMLIVPLWHIIYRLHKPVIFVFGPDNAVEVLLQDSQLMVFLYYSSATFYITTTGFAAIFNVLSMFKFYFSKNAANTNVREKSLFILTCFVFLTQVVRLCYNFARPIFASNPDIIAILVIALPFFYDAFAWVGSIFLLLLSSSARKEYLNFYMRNGSTKGKSSSHFFTTGAVTVY